MDADGATLSVPTFEDNDDQYQDNDDQDEDNDDQDEHGGWPICNLDPEYSGQRDAFRVVAWLEIGAPSPRRLLVNS